MVSFFVYKNSTTSSLSRIQMRQSRVSIIDKVWSYVKFEHKLN